MANPIVTPLVAILDGNSQRRTAMAESLSPFYTVTTEGDGFRALDQWAETPPAAAVVDELIAPRGALGFLKEMRRRPPLAGTPVIILADDPAPAAGKMALEAGAAALLARPVPRNALIEQLSQQVNRAVEAGWAALPPHAGHSLRKTVDAFNRISSVIDRGEPVPFEEVKDACLPLVHAVRHHDYRPLLDGVRTHDNYTYVHSLRVATFLSLFGHTLGLGEHDLLVLATGGLVHDIGKMDIPRDVLNKPGRLDPRELDIMRGHVTRTEACLSDAHVPHAVMTIAAQHHEKLDGTGYPRGLAKDQLDDLARMASICDVFGALTDRRCYKPPLDPEQALDIMTSQMRDELDQHLLVLFREMLMDAAGTEGKGLSA